MPNAPMAGMPPMATPVAPPAVYTNPMMGPQGSGGAPPDGPPVPGRLRTVPVAKTLLLGIITLGIYFLVRGYKCSGDLHRIQGGNANWQLFFWLQLIPYAGIVFMLILYFQNNKQANLLRQQRGLPMGYTPFILACIPIVNIAAPFVWASYYNELAVRT